VYTGLPGEEREKNTDNLELATAHNGVKGESSVVQKGPARSKERSRSSKFWLNDRR